MSVAILWDIENIPPASKVGLIKSIYDECSKYGRITNAMAFNDWNAEHSKSCGLELSLCNFELINVPHINKKNDVDISIIIHTVELLFNYPHINTFALVSSDSDFIQLISLLKKHGKKNNNYL
ncbi:MAG: NYN domain-containing protein [Deltaproteobacteria bacterium]|jgi:hypothetical protein|nr:NYN domain-containing protein [Deltaproteobacteria bacterium]